MIRPLLLDLFCGAGGAARGYHAVGFDVIGIDIESQPRYPYEFVQGDALTFADGKLWAQLGCRTVRAIHASCPCQAYSRLNSRHKREYPRLIEPTRKLLRDIGLPYVIENVPDAPLLNPILLCGTMFPPLRVFRHRHFESNVKLTAPVHPPHPFQYTTDLRKPYHHEGSPFRDFVQVYGGGQAPIRAQRDAMGISWMIRKELNEAIPPAYTEHIGRQLITQL